MFYDQLLMFAVQMESEVVKQAESSKKNDDNVSPSPSKVDAAMKQASALKLARSMTVAPGNKSASSKLSEGVSLQRRASTLRSLWTSNDFAVCKIIAVLAKSRMQIFSNTISREYKQQMK